MDMWRVQLAFDAKVNLTADATMLGLLQDSLHLLQGVVGTMGADENGTGYLAVDTTMCQETTMDAINGAVEIVTEKVETWLMKPVTLRLVTAIPVDDLSLYGFATDETRP